MTDSAELERLKGAFAQAFLLVEDIAARAIKANLESRMIFLTVMEGFIQAGLITRETFAEMRTVTRAAMSVEAAVGAEARATEEAIQKFRQQWRKALSMLDPGSQNP